MIVRRSAPAIYSGPRPALSDGPPALIWDAELAQLRRHLDQLASGTPESACLLFEGREDDFLDELMDQVESLSQDAGRVVYVGRGRHPRDYPYELFAPAIHALSQTVDLNAPSAGFAASAAAEIVPLATTVNNMRPLPPAQAAIRFRALLAECFFEASRQQPIVLVLRDLEWASPESLDVLQTILRDARLIPTREPESSGATNFFVVGSFTVPERSVSEKDPLAKSASALRQLGNELPVRLVRLEKLRPDRLAAWVGISAPQVAVSQDLIHRLYELSGAKPQLVEEFLRRLRHASGSDQKPNADSLLDLPRTAAESVFERFERLPPPARAIGELLAAARGSLKLTELQTLLKAPAESQATGSSPSANDKELSSWLALLQQEGFVRTLPEIGGSEISLNSSTLLDSIYRSLSAHRRWIIHRQIAKQLERTSPPSQTPIRIAFHAWKGEMPVLFLRRALEASVRLVEVHAYDSAIEIFNRILDFLTHWTSPPVESVGAGPTIEPTTEETDAPAPPISQAEAAQLRRFVNEQLVDAYLHSRQTRRALERLTILSSFYDQTTPVLLASVYRRMGEIYRREGEEANALFFLGKSLSKLKECAANRWSPTAPPPLAPWLTERIDTKPPGRTDEEILTRLELALCCLDRIDLQDAEAHIAKVLELTAKRSTQRCQALVLKAEIENRSGRHQDATEHSLEALRIAKSVDDPTLVVEALGVVSAYYLERGEYDEVVAYTKERLKVATALSCTQDIASCHTMLGTTHYNRGDHPDALQCYAKSLTIYKQLGDTKGIADGFLNLGNVHKLADGLAQARECYSQAITLYSHANDQSGVARGMSSLALLLELEGKYNEALDYAFRALQRRNETKATADIAFSYYRIGKIYQAKGVLDKALSFAERGLRLRRQNEDRLGVANSLLQLAEIHWSQANYLECFLLWRDAHRGFQRLKNRVGMLFSREIFGRLLIRLGRLSNAQRVLGDVLFRSRELQQPMLVASCLLQLASIARQRRDYNQAERALAEARDIFQVDSAQRSLVDTLLELACVALDGGKVADVDSLLEEAYTRLESLGIRDLVPYYFLLRGRLEAVKKTIETHREAKKSFARGLKEAEEEDLRELTWQFHFHLAQLEEAGGDPQQSAAEHRRASEELHEIATALPPSFQRRFYETPERGFVVEAAGTHQVARPQVDRNSPALHSAASAEESAERERLVSGAAKLHEVAVLMGEEEDLKTLLEEVLVSILELVEADRGFVFLSPDQPGSTAAAAVRARGKQPTTLEEAETALSSAVATDAFRSRQTVLVDDVQSDARWRDVITSHEISVKSLLCVPMRCRGQTLGVIYLDNSRQTNAFRRNDPRLVLAFADQAGVAVTNAHLVSENQKRNQELTQANDKLRRFNQKLRHRVHRRAVQLSIAHADLQYHQLELEDRYRFDNIVGRSRAMQLVYHLLEKVAATDLPVLLEGESGTGKELIARAIHFNSLHQSGRFVSENCGGVAESIVDSEWFGHVRGAFTGAEEDKMGLFELADGGTLFLDELDEMPMPLQLKLLRVLQEGEFRKVGAKDVTNVNVRVVAAASSSLYDLVDDGTFRKDLYYRLNGVHIPIPPLRERKEDIPLLVRHFCEEVAARTNSPRMRFTQEASKCLRRHDWPGNVRELRSTVQQAGVIASGQPITPAHLPLDVPTKGQLPTLKAAREQFEGHFLQTALDSCDGNVAETARTCSVSRETLYRLLRKHGLRSR